MEDLHLCTPPGGLHYVAASATNWSSSHTNIPISAASRLSGITFHVDDSAIFAGANYMDTIKSELKSKFDTQDLGELNHFVGIKITRDWVNWTITISQDQHICNILE